jgi:hypothetical protein
MYFPVGSGSVESPEKGPSVLIKRPVPFCTRNEYPPTSLDACVVATKSPPNGFREIEESAVVNSVVADVPPITALLAVDPPGPERSVYNVDEPVTPTTERPGSRKYPSPPLASIE